MDYDKVAKYIMNHINIGGVSYSETRGLGIYIPIDISRYRSSSNIWQIPFCALVP